VALGITEANAQVQKGKKYKIYKGAQFSKKTALLFFRENIRKFATHNFLIFRD
jgi:hypothetical protein